MDRGSGTKQLCFLVIGDELSEEEEEEEEKEEEEEEEEEGGSESSSDVEKQVSEPISGKGKPLLVVKGVFQASITDYLSELKM